MPLPYAANHTVEPWKDPKDKGALGSNPPATPMYPAITAACGDSIYFQWNSKKKPHGVFLLAGARALQLVSNVLQDVWYTCGDVGELAGRRK